MMRDVAVIGAGPAGLMAAETLAASGCRVVMFDRMATPGRKFLMAGCGGLNLSHSEPIDALLGRYGAARSRLEPAIGAFPPDAVRAWCEGLGQKVFVGSSGRVFPRSMKASPLLRAWLARLAAAGVTFAVRHRWLGWTAEGALRFSTPAGPTEGAFDAHILALGGASWPRLGSDGAWATVLRDGGIGVSSLMPANCGVRIAWSAVFRDRFEGQPLKRITLRIGGTQAGGEAMVTRAGLEGGAVYAVSAAVRDTLFRDGAADLRIDLRPDVTASDLTDRLSAPKRGQSTANVLRRAASLPPVAIGLLREAVGPDLGTMPPAAVAQAIKACPVTVIGLGGLDRAISTAGGVALADTDARFMLHRRPGCFVAGEMLDWEAPTGGYLLQACFSTGVAAGRGALAWLAERPAMSDDRCQRAQV